ncbi:MAG: NADH-quinone oxidoreductase subunit J [Gammaproteobacteria bacterium]|nr:NADH-quinone oxidoreductase subunit J [Gammaproteobacteria bacterium]
MTFQQFVFYIFAAIMLFAAARMITVRNPVYGALYLVLTFFTSAALWMLLEAEFLAIALVLVYVGAVMVLFLFVVMMLDINIAELRSGFTQYVPLGLVVAVVMVIEMALIVGSETFNRTRPSSVLGNISNTEALGRVLYTEYVYPFEIAAVILLVAIIAAISLTLRRRPETKYQDPATQIGARSASRVRLVSMPSERRPERAAAKSQN